MMNDRQTALISLLLGSFPNFASGDGEAALGAYALVLRQADERDHEPGVMILINGEYPGHDGRFAPTAPQLASAIRMARDKRLERERIGRIHQPALPAPDVEHSPESQAKVRAMMAEAVAKLGAGMRTDDAAVELAKRQAKEKLVKHDAFFAEDYVATDGGVGRISKSLARIIGYEVGDEDGDREVA